MEFFLGLGTGVAINTILYFIVTSYVRRETFSKMHRFCIIQGLNDIEKVLGPYETFDLIINPDLQAIVHHISKCAICQRQVYQSRKRDLQQDDQIV
jgi:hypothetical protein